jgi:glycosyltransferase involved in cell wall biosynthesis
MAYGVVPLAGAVSSIPQILAHAGVGRSIPAGDVESFAETVEWYVRRPEQWELESRAGIQVATAFTYSSFLQKVDEMFREKWGSDLLRPKNKMEPFPSTCPRG